jgi:7-cyano-7-deazaguanine tRNA-ribosyltransferase
MGAIVTLDGKRYATPLFLPVLQYQNHFVTAEALQNEFEVKGIITNGFFLYRNRELRSRVQAEGIKKFLGFDGLVATDSGAFQQFSGSVYLSNSTIIRFQQEIGADIVSPLDIITTPGDNRTTAEKKWIATLKRIKQGMLLMQKSILIGVQQGGRFLELRKKSLQDLVSLGAKYIALGGLVPFFNKNHSIEFIGKVILDASQIVPQEIPLHLYGGGDPLELPFYIALGCHVFDSSSFIHYAQDGWYMTPYGALQGEKRLQEVQYSCDCKYCTQNQKTLWQDEQILAAHNLKTILQTIERARQLQARNALKEYLEEIVYTHQKWFPGSRLAGSWSNLKKLLDGT